MNTLQAARLFLMARGRGGENANEDTIALAKLLNECVMAGVRSQKVTRWGQLIEEFQRLRERTGNDKASSYEVKVWVDLYAGWTLEFGTYDIADWPRHTKLGTFSSEEEALIQFERMIEKAKEAIDKAGV